MGKRSDFERVEKDFYRTIDPRAGNALWPHVAVGTQYSEPCVGGFDLYEQLDPLGFECVQFSDLSGGVDALSLKSKDLNGADCIITNPPWSRPILHAMISHFIDIAPYAWLLFDADWAHTKQSAPYMKHCSHIVSVGRLIWMPGTKMSGKDNCAWYRFSKGADGTRFYGR